MTDRPARIDPYNVVPKYYQLCEIIRRYVEDGEWQPHQAIPSERELESRYGISRTTIRQAIDLLVNQGYLYRKHGSGTFVARPKVQHSLHVLQSFTDEMKRRGLEPGQRVLGLAYVEPAPRIRQSLQLGPEVERVLKVERLRLTAGEPLGIDEAFLPIPEAQAFTVQELEATGSLYALLQARYNLVPAEADETLEATAAGPREAGLLGVKEGSPLLLVERTTWSDQHRPMEFARMLGRADRYRYYVHITRSPLFG